MYDAIASGGVGCFIKSLPASFLHAFCTVHCTHAYRIPMEGDRAHGQQ